VACELGKGGDDSEDSLFDSDYGDGISEILNMVMRKCQFLLLREN
jgi:hypothetical protein